MTSNIQQGFTLIEVLVSVLVVAIGLLGLAGLNTVGINNSHVAYLRSIASIHSENMAEMMRANLTAVDANNYTTPAIINYATIRTTTAPTLDCRPDITGTTSFTGGNTRCTTTEQAQVDAFNWVAALNNDLPNGTGSVVCEDSVTTDADACTNGSAFTISVSWREKELESGQTEGQTNLAKSFTTVFRP